MLVGTAIAITYMFNTFVTASEFEEYVLSDMYDSYYAFLDRKYKYEELGNDDMVRSINRQLARLRAKICAQDPEWEECDGNSE